MATWIPRCADYYLLVFKTDKMLLERLAVFKVDKYPGPFDADCSGEKIGGNCRDHSHILSISLSLYPHVFLKLCQNDTR